MLNGKKKEEKEKKEIELNNLKAIYIDSMKTLGLIISIIILFSGCVTLDDQLLLIDDANYSTDLNVDDANFTNLNDTPANYTGASLECVRVNAGETGLEFAVCAAGGGGVIYTGVLPIDVNSDTNVISLDVNAASDWLGLFDGYDSNEFILVVDGNLLFYTQFDLNLLFGENINQMLYDVGDPHFDNVTVDNLSVNGNLTANGNVITGTAKFLMDLIPNDDDQEDLGSNALRWRVLYVHDINALNDVNAGERFCLDGDCILEWSTVTDSNIWSEGFLDDQNALTQDLNMNENNIINVNDFNGQQIFIQTGDLNFFVFDKNILMQTVNGAVTFFPDLNKTCVGSDPNAMACYWVTCGATDCNGVFGME